MSFPDEIWAASEKLYRDSGEIFKKTRKCSLPKADRATFEELKKAFSPGRTVKDVRKPCDKISRLAETIISNSELFSDGAEPSCKAIGLDKKSSPDEKMYNRCYFEEDQSRMTCDCPDGYASYTPKQYAEAHVVKCLDGDGVEMFYTDNPISLDVARTDYDNATDVQRMVLGCDAMVNAIHGSGPMAKFLIKGGVETLDRLKQE